MKDRDQHFYQFLHNYLIDYLEEQRKMSPATIKTYKQSLNQFRKYMKEKKEKTFIDLSFEDFSRDSVYEYLVWLRDDKKVSVQTLNLRLSVLKSFLKYCCEEEISHTAAYLELNTIHAFKGVKKPQVEYLTQEQLKQLFAIPDATTANGRRNRFFIIFAYETGARMDELLNLKLSDIISGDTYKKIRIVGKGSKIRYVPLMEDTVKHLQVYLEEFHAESLRADYLFFTIHQHKHTQMTAGTVDYFLKKYAKELQNTLSDFPPNLHAHMLRHSIAMAMYKNGIPISYIKDFLGHSSIDTTAIYSYSDDETIAKALEAVEQQPFQKEKKAKNWKGNEAELLKYCGLS